MRGKWIVGGQSIQWNYPAFVLCKEVVLFWNEGFNVNGSPFYVRYSEQWVIPNCSNNSETTETSELKVGGYNRRIYLSK